MYIQQERHPVGNTDRKDTPWVTPTGETSPVEYTRRDITRGVHQEGHPGT